MLSPAIEQIIFKYRTCQGVLNILIRALIRDYGEWHCTNDTKC
jgi:hypothetical protein